MTGPTHLQPHGFVGELAVHAEAASGHRVPVHEPGQSGAKKKDEGKAGVYTQTYTHAVAGSFSPGFYNYCERERVCRLLVHRL